MCEFLPEVYSLAPRGQAFLFLFFASAFIVALIVAGFFCLCVRPNLGIGVPPVSTQARSGRSDIFRNVYTEVVTIAPSSCILRVIHSRCFESSESHPNRSHNTKPPLVGV